MASSAAHFTFQMLRYCFAPLVTRDSLTQIARGHLAQKPARTLFGNSSDRARELAERGEWVELPREQAMRFSMPTVKLSVV